MPSGSNTLTTENGLVFLDSFLLQMKRALIYFLILVFLIACFVLWKVFGPAVNNPGKKYLYIPFNASYAQLKDSLIKNNFLTSLYVFDKLADYAKLPENVKPGKYKIENGLSVFHLVKRLRSGRQDPVNLVITKIRTKEDLARRISRYLETDSSAALSFLNNNDSLRKFGVDTSTLLADVFPDTYTFFWTADMNTIFSKFYKEREKFWTSERINKAAAHHLTPNQVYILASIVEEETNKKDDKGKIASVYINRLRKGMPLAADPTIKFAIKDFALTRVYHKHLDVVSPYNTYRNAGLPPGPICTPTPFTIDAVLDAPETNYLFFVAKPDFSGYSNFAETYAEHLIYAKAYQNALDSLWKNRQSKKEVE